MAVRVSKGELTFHFCLIFDPLPVGWQSNVYVGEIPAPNPDRAVELINELIERKKSAGEWKAKIVGAKLLSTYNGSEKK